MEIGSLRFSLLGNLIVEDLKTWDRDSSELISVGRFEAVSSLLELLKGHYIFDEIRISDVAAHLSQREDGLNIQFLMESFVSDSDRDPSSKAIRLEFKKVLLDNIAFEFISEVSGTSIKVDFDSLLVEEAAYASELNLISGDRVVLDGALLNILSSGSVDSIAVVDTANIGFQFSPDFGLGIGLELLKLDITNSGFTYHQGQVAETPKFDPSHIDVKRIQVAVSDFVMHADTLGVSIDTLTGDLNGFSLMEARAGIHMNHQGIALDEFHATSGKNVLQANLNVSGVGGAGLTAQNPDFDVTFQSRLDPDDISYFLTDSIQQLFKGWGITDIGAALSYSNGSGSLSSLSIKSDVFSLEARGEVNELLDMKKLNWQDLNIVAKADADLASLLAPFIGDIGIPDNMEIRMITSGSFKEIYVDGRANTSWGNVKAKGKIAPVSDSYSIDLHAEGDNIYLNRWVDMPWLGAIALSADAKGLVGAQQDLQVNGVVSAVEVMDQDIHDISFKGEVQGEHLTADIAIKDPAYQSLISTEVSYADSILVNADVQLTGFNVGSFLHTDSTLMLSGDFNIAMQSVDTLISGSLRGRQVLVDMSSESYALDTISVKASLSPGASMADYYADDAQGNLVANFDIRDSLDVVEDWIRSLLVSTDSIHAYSGNRTLQFEARLIKPDILKLLGIPVDQFSTLSMKGGFDQQAQSAQLYAVTGAFKGSGIALDSLRADFTAAGNRVTGDMDVDNLMYSDYSLGHLKFNMNTKGDTIMSDLLLSRDSVSILDLGAHFLPREQGVYVYPDRMQFFGEQYQFGQDNPIIISDSNVTMDHFLIEHKDMELSLDGDLNAFDVYFKRMDLTRLNDLLFQDSTIITNGHLAGTIKYVQDEQLDLKADIDSLSLYHSDPLTVSLSAVKDGDDVPFQFMLTNTTNKVDVEGHYGIDREIVNASIDLDVNNLELFSFLMTDVLEEMHGAIKGEATVQGPVANPDFKGSVRFKDVGFTTVDPSLTFNIADEVITLDTSGLSVKDFTLYDKSHSPLIINGGLRTRNFQTYTYDFNLKTDHFTLMSTPESSKDQLKGLLVLATDMQLKGNEKDTYVNGKITIKDTTSLTYVVSNDAVDLLRTEGIVEFVDPGQLTDTADLDSSATFYDSLVATLPDFILNCTIYVEENAGLRVITNEQSGDYFQANGAANLEVGYDRMGGLTLNGKYTITEGEYRMSFYDLVKKNFSLSKGSSITWNGIPENGDLAITAQYTVASNSIGLIGHEIGENEQSAYKRSLDYIVGINIKGTIEKPEVSFTLDLSKAERTNYPVLANKLDRLKSPEYQSELNKQVFGLLVLGGFIPESSTADLNENVIATTAITNSVNALLAGQLNRFAGQHIKGVNIDVGLQSYSDYSTPGGKTVTSMDFRVSKSILDDRLSFEIGGDFDINADQSGANTGSNNYRGDMAIIYDLTGNGDKQLKLFNNETYDIIYQEVRNTGISLIFIREFNKGEKSKRKKK